MLQILYKTRSLTHTYIYTYTHTPLSNYPKYLANRNVFPSWRERNSSEHIALRITLPIPRAPNLKHNERVKPIETAPIETTMWKKPVRFNPEVESRMKRAQKRRTLGRVEEEGGGWGKTRTWRRRRPRVQRARRFVMITTFL